MKLVVFALLAALVAANQSLRNDVSLEVRRLATDEELLKDVCSRVEGSVLGDKADAYSSAAGDFAVEMFNSFRPELPFIGMMKNDDMGTITDDITDWFKNDALNTLTGMIVIVGVFLLLFVYSLLFCLSFGCCCCCACCCKKKTRGEKHGKCYKLLPGICFIIFGAIVVAAAACGLTYEAMFNSGLKEIQCSVLTTFDETLNGADGAWGIIGAQKLAEDTKTNINAAINDINSQINTPEYKDNWGTGKNPMSEVKAKLEALRDASFTQADCTVSDKVLLDQMAANFDAYTEMGAQMNNVYSMLVDGLGGTSGMIDDTMNMFTEILSSAQDAVEGIQESIQKVLGGEVDTYNGYRGMGFTIVFAVYIGAAGIGFISILLACVLRLRKLSWISHCSWCPLNLILIFGSLLGFLLMVVGFLGNELCGITAAVMNKDSIDDFPVMEPFAPVLKECVWGDGNMRKVFDFDTSQFNFTSALGDAKEITSIKDDDELGGPGKPLNDLAEGNAGDYDLEPACQTALSTEHGNYKTEWETFLGSAQGLAGAIDTLVNSDSSPTTIVLESTNKIFERDCRIPLKKAYTSFDGAVCGKIIPGILLLAIALFVASVASVAAVIIQLVLARRLKYNPSEGQTIPMNIQMGQIPGQFQFRDHY